MTSQHNWPVAIIGSGDLGTDLMMKILNGDGPLTLVAMIGGDQSSEGLLDLPNFADIKLVFDTTGATAGTNRDPLADAGVRVLDLTGAGSGPYCVPAVNTDEHLDAPNLNLATCGAQASVPIVAAVANAGIVSYAEIVTSISTKSAGPAMRAGIDTFTETTAAAAQVVGGAQRGKAVMLLSPADPPILMRNTVFCLVEGLPGESADQQRIESDVLAMVDRVRAYVPGYRLKHRVQFEAFTAGNALYIPETGKFIGTRVTVLLEIACARDYLPAHCGNIDIMSSAAITAAERIAVAHETAGAPS